MGLRDRIWALDARADHVPSQLLTKYARVYWEVNSQILGLACDQGGFKKS